MSTCDTAALTPKAIVAELDRYIIGQQDAKRAVSIALRNRWRRQNVPDELRDEIHPKNIILIGPTGVGKTEIARRLAKLANAPFIKVEASKFTEVGYVGRDVESMIRDLTEIAVTQVKLEELVRAEAEPSRLLLVDDLSDPHNLGATLRTAAALSIDGVVIAGPSAPPLGGAVAKAAAGLLGRVPLARARVAADAISRLQRKGYWAFAADAAGTPIGQVQKVSRWVLCIGAEERGLRAKTRSRIDEFVAVPMAEGVESLNLSVSAGILLWELSQTN